MQTKNTSSEPGSPEPFQSQDTINQKVLILESDTLNLKHKQKSDAMKIFFSASKKC